MASEHPIAEPSLSRRLLDLAIASTRLGLTSFGGPIAHLAYFRAEFVARRKWLDDKSYGDLVALTQLLPGPASSQVMFAIGLQRAGLLGAIVASSGFTLPSAGIMLGLAYGLDKFPTHDERLLHGLMLTAVAVVAQAAWGMGRRLCTDSSTIAIALASAAVALLLPGVMSQLLVLLCGGLFGLWHSSDISHENIQLDAPKPSRGAVIALITFGGLLVGLPIVSHLTHIPAVATFDGFYRAGALVVGGGHVVLPLLRMELVPRGWISDEQFLAGYGAAQALPGPLFAVSAYLGASLNSTMPPWLSGLMCLFALFLPGWLLIGGALPFWRRLRGKVYASRALVGANAAVVGLVLAALYTPVMTESVHGPKDAAAVLIAFGLLEHGNAPPWAVGLILAVLGYAIR